MDYVDFVSLRSFKPWNNNEKLCTKILLAIHGEPNQS